MPVAVTAFVISEKYNLDTQFAAMTMLVSTIASVASITAIAELIV
jgi:predicted permease